MGNTFIYRLMIGEIDIVDELLIAAYGLAQGRKRALQRYLALQPDGAFVAEQDGTIVGFGAAIQYGTFAYIGLMAVRPDMQKRGVGRFLLEYILNWLDISGCSTVLLDATPAGAQLYERLGFVDDDTTVVLRYSGEQTDSVLGVSNRYTYEMPGEHYKIETAASAEILRAEELPALFAYDAHYFGSERATVLASYWADDPRRVLGLHSKEGQITGYLIAQSGVLGPWVADSEEIAECLLVSALALPFKSGPGVFVSAHNETALALLERYGFSQQRTLRHMCRGENVQRSRSTAIYGQASLGLG